MMAETRRTQIRGQTLSVEDRLNQMEDLISNIKFGNVATTTELAMVSLRSEGLDEGAIIDNGCTANVCSEGWLTSFERKTNKKFKRIAVSQNGPVKTFVFGSGLEHI